MTGYKISRGGLQIATSTVTSFSDTGLTASTAYTYTVSAFDAAGNVSAPATATATHPIHAPFRHDAAVCPGQSKRERRVAVAD